MSHSTFNISGQVLISRDGSVLRATQDEIKRRMNAKIQREQLIKRTGKIIGNPISQGSARVAALASSQDSHGVSALSLDDIPQSVLSSVTGVQVEYGAKSSNVPGDPDYDGSVMHTPSQYSLFENQVTNGGVQAILAALSTQSAPLIAVTNIFFLTGFTVPDGKTLQTIEFSDIEPFIASQAFVGNNGRINSDNTRDMRTYISTEPPFELTCIATLPSDRGNVEPTINAVALILQGDTEQSTSRGSDSYVPVGTEVLFSVATFTEQVKQSTEPFSCVWYVTIQS